MITVTEAEKIITDNFPLFPATKSSIEESCGKTLREDIVADRGNPPFHRVAMDGIAIIFEAYENGARTFKISGIAPAGKPQVSLNEKNSCVEVMTGAVLPEGADCVIRVEDIEVKENQATLKEGLKLEKMQNVHIKNSDYQPGAILLKSGQTLLGPEIAVAASVGKSNLFISENPSIAIIATGDELVDVDETPLEHQIRCSNLYAIKASLKLHGYNKTSTFQLKDNKEELKSALKNIIEENDLVLLSGGVSMGKFDFTPIILEELGVKKLFHKIQQKPGKPMWFGKKENDCLVFGLPGNPVSAIVCLHRYILPALKRASGVQTTTELVKLAEDFRYKKNLVYFLPVKLHQNREGFTEAFPVKMNGSGDFASLANSDGFIELQAEEENYKAGISVPLYRWSSY